MNCKIIGFDFEVFKHDWLVVFIDYETKEKTIIINNANELREFYNKHLDDIYVGYNSRNYDVWIYKAILSGMNAYYMSEQLIKYRKRGYRILKRDNFPINNYDVGSIDKSLKQLEGFMGHMIKESDVSFDLDRPLTEDELKETIYYCVHDVEECISVFEYKREDFDAQLMLIDEFDLAFENFNKTKAQLSANILGAVKQHTMDDEFELTIPDTLIINKYTEVIDWFKNPKNLTYKEPLFSYERQHNNNLEIEIAGVKHIIGWGGIHGAIDNYIGEGIILCADVASLYPALMINYDYLSRKVKDKKVYKKIRDERLRLKALKDKKQLPLKLVLNSTYGILKDRNNSFYDPLMSNNVCVAGQLFIIDLIEKIEHLCKLIQSNTDGIFLLVKDMETVEEIKNIAHEWEKRTGLELEFDIFNKIYQKDVNNYIIIPKEPYDDKGKPKYKSKGAYVKQLSPIDYDLPIINKALIEYFVNGTSIEDTINNENKLIEFQKIVKLTNLYKGVMYGELTREKQKDGVEVTKIINGQELKEKVNRVFASSDEHAKGIYKVKLEKGIEKYEKIANTPDKSFIDNSNIVGKLITDDMKLDKQYYIKLAYERLSHYLDKKIEKVDDLPEIMFNIYEKSDTFYDFLKNSIEYDKNIVDDKDTKIRVKTKSFLKYINADCFSKYGKTKRITEYLEVFKYLYGKKTLRVIDIDKKLENEIVKSFVVSRCELNKSGKTYSFDYEKVLIDLWNIGIIPNVDNPINEILESQVELFKEVRYTDENYSDDTYYILNSRHEIAPNLITYRIKDGLIENKKVDKKSHGIIPLQDGDIIKVTSSEQRYRKEIIGKDEKGVNIIDDDISTQYEYFCSYEVIYRDFKKKNYLTEMEEDDFYD